MLKNQHQLHMNKNTEDRVVSIGYNLVLMYCWVDAKKI